MTSADIADVIRDRMASQRRVPLRAVESGETQGQAWVRLRLKDGAVVTFVEVDE